MDDKDSSATTQASLLSAAESRVLELESENARLRERALALELDRRRISESSMVDQSTGFKNEEALRKYLAEVLAILEQSGGTMAMVLYELGNAEAMRNRYGERKWDEATRRAGAFLRAMAPVDTMAFKAGDYRFAFLLPDHTESEAAAIAAASVGALELASIFDERIPASVIIEPVELWTANTNDTMETAEALLEECDSRMKAACADPVGAIHLTTSPAEMALELPVVFVVEPDSFNAVVAMDLLTRHGMRCEWYRDGIEAFEKMRATRPAAVVSELSVPRMNGMALRRAMRESGRIVGLHTVPFILLAERKDDSLIRAAADLDIAHYIRKPYFLAELLAVVMDAVYMEAALARGRADT
jgi:PleD family two-component response regulator